MNNSVATVPQQDLFFLAIQTRYIAEQQMACERWCESRNVQPLDTVFLEEKCLKIPLTEGLQHIVFAEGGEDKHHYYNEVTEFFDWPKSGVLGTYRLKNGLMMFFNTKGDAYLTIDEPEVVSFLEAAGYVLRSGKVPVGDQYETPESAQKAFKFLKKWHDVLS